MKKGKVADSNGTELPNKSTIKRRKDGDSHKYFGAIQTDGTKHHEKKEKVKKCTISK